jgi:ElaB/YqjD/DUF883 family membrane-anchored ribosome-binding protein
MHIGAHSYAVLGTFSVLIGGASLLIARSERRIVFHSTFRQESPMENGTDSPLRHVAQDAQHAATRFGEKIEDAVDSMDFGDAAEEIGDKVRGTARSVSDRVRGAVKDSARYVTNTDRADLMRDAGDLVKRHPRAAMMAVAVVGFMIGRSVRRET